MRKTRDGSTTGDKPSYFDGGLENEFCTRKSWMNVTAHYVGTRDQNACLMLTAMSCLELAVVFIGSNGWPSNPIYHRDLGKNVDDDVSHTYSKYGPLCPNRITLHL